MSRERDAETVLVVDDDEAFRTRLARAFADRGHPTRSAATADEALALAAEESPEWAIVDLRVGEDSGLRITEGLLRVDPTTRIVLLTGYGSIATAVSAMKLGAVDYATKPTDPETLVAKLRGTPPEPDAPDDVPSLARVEWEHMQRVLHDAGGNVSEAARRLGMHRRSLQRKLSKDPVRK